MAAWTPPTAAKRIDQMVRTFSDDLRTVDNMAGRQADEILSRQASLREFIAAQPIDWVELLPSEYISQLRQAIAEKFGVVARDDSSYHNFKLL